MRVLSKLLALSILTQLGQSLTSLDTEKDVLFMLKRRERKFSDEEIFTISTRDKLNDAAFDPSKPTVYLIHGFMESRKTQHYVAIGKDLLAKSDVNVFVVDWGKGAYDIDYSAAKAKVNDVAKAVAEFHTYLQQVFGLDSSKTTCIGFSLGAHACGLIYQYLANDKFGTVIGIDPASLKFDINDSTTRISPESATYVECIHTSTFPFGIRANVCQADFFVNKALQQPGCQNFMRLDNPICSHNRALDFFREALGNSKAFYGKACYSLRFALEGSCNREPGAFMAHEENAANRLTGIFSLLTNMKSPYGRGKEY